MVNSRLGLVTAAPRCKVNHTKEHPFSRSYGVILPSSLTRVLSRALEFSSCLPVSVYGTGTGKLARGFSWQFGVNDFGTTFPSPSHFNVTPDGFACLTAFVLGRTLPTVRFTYPPASPQLLKRLLGGTGISTSCPSPTPCGLGLGPGLPWADEPSPGNLRLSAGRIPTCLLAYLCQHSLFLTVHYSSRYSFYPLGMLPYQCIAYIPQLRYHA